MDVTITQTLTSLDYSLEDDVEDYFVPFLYDKDFIIFKTPAYTFIGWDFAFEIKSNNKKFLFISKDKRFDHFKRLNGQPFLESLESIISSINIKQNPSFKTHLITKSLIGYLGYEFVSLLESKLSFLTLTEDDLFLTFPKKQLFYDHKTKELAFLSIGYSSLGFEPDKYNNKVYYGYKTDDFFTLTNKSRFLESVRKAKEYILCGDIFQAVLSVRFGCRFKGDPYLIFKRLKELNPSPYMFFLKTSSITLIGSSPETLVKCQDSILEERPIAGTRPKPLRQQDMERVKEDLLSDPKERAEHVMLVDLSRNDLGRIAEYGSVYVEDFMFLETFSHVVHITSIVKAKLKRGLSAIDMVKATFPAGTVSGAPKIRAMEIISELEDISRGPYAGAVGWIGLDKENISLDLAITIRSLWIKNGYAFWQAGAGIVMDSSEEKEWEECINKAKVLTHILKMEEKK